MRLKHPAFAAVGGRIAGQVVRLLFRSIDNEIHMPGIAQPYNAPEEQTERFLYSAWHDSALLAGFGGRHTRTVALTSRHRDGTFTANLLRAANVGNVRGSTGRSGANAARALLETAATHDIVITPDGPRGPRRVVSKGIVFLASKTGNAIVPTAFAAKNAWDIKGSWTTLTVPKPFSKVVSLTGEPIYVPKDLSRDGIEQYRQQAQSAMVALQACADEMIDGVEISAVAAGRAKAA